MTFSGFIKTNIINKLLSNEGNIKNISLILDELKQTEPSISYKNLNPYLFINRQDEITKIAAFLDDTSQRLLLFGGIQGSGKSTTVRSTLATCQEHILIYWYECSKITNLDDILLSLCGFFDRKLNKEAPIQKQKNLISIDERLISYLKSLNRDIIIVLDSIESLVSPEFVIEDEELKHFFNYLLNHPKIKLILIGQRLPTGDMEYSEDFITELRIGGLNEDKSIKLLKEQGLEGANSSLSEIYKLSRGYPWLLLLSYQVSLNYNISVNKIIQDMSIYDDTYESFLIKIARSNFTDIEKLITNYVSIFRHPINIPTLSYFDKSVKDVSNEINHLINLKIVKGSTRRFNANNTVRKNIYNDIPNDQKYDYHLALSKFYAEETAKKITQRTVRLSRKLLRSEQFFHNNTATKFYTDKEKFQRNVKYSPQTNTKTNTTSKSSEIKPASQEALLEYERLKGEYTFDTKEVAHHELDTDYQLPLSETKSSNEIKKELLQIDGFEIELTEEEKELIEKASEDSSNSEEVTLYEKETEYQTETHTEKPSRRKKTVQDNKLKQDIDFKLDYEIELNDETSIKSNLEVVESLIFVAKSYAKENKHSIAIERFKEALDISEKLNDNKYIAKVLTLMAGSYSFLKQYELALGCHNKCKAIYTEQGDFHNFANTMVLTGHVYSECYQHEKALQHFYDTLKLPAEHLSNSTIANSYLGIGEIFDYRGQLRESLTYYNNALQAFIEIDDIVNQALLYSRIGLIYDDLSEFENAIKNYETSLKLDNQIGEKERYAATLSNLAAVCDELGERAQALKYYKQSLIIDKELNNIDGLYKTLSRIGTIYIDMDRTDLALKYYKQELLIAKKVNDPYWIAMAYLDLGDLHYFIKEYVKAAKYFFISQKVIRKSISTDSKEKIERRLRTLLDYIPKDQFENIKEQIMEPNND